MNPHAHIRSLPPGLARGAFVVAAIDAVRQEAA
jgi:hypothetical protein